MIEILVYDINLDTTSTFRKQGTLRGPLQQPIGDALSGGSNS